MSSTFLVLFQSGIKQLLFYICCLLFIAHFALAQNPYPNLDFAAQNFGQWKLYRGPQQGAGGARTINYVDISTTGATVPGNAFQFIYPPTNPAASLYDPNTCYNIFRIPEGKAYSVRVGPLSPGGYGSPHGYKAAYTIHVVPEQVTIVYRFAFVQQFDHGSSAGGDPGGFGGSPTGAGNNATMWMQTLDAGGNQIAGVCGNYRLYPGAASDVGWFTWNKCGEISNTPWITDVIDLSPFVGQDITLEFNTMDCYTGFHMAYAYISPELFPSDTTMHFCPGGIASLKAPRGFKTYEWKELGGTFTQTKNNAAQIGHDLPDVHELIVSNPVHGVRYECTFTSYSGCSGKVIYELIADSIHAGFSYIEGSTACQQVVFTDTSSADNGHSITAWEWNFEDPASGTNTSLLSSATHVFSALQTYHISLIVHSSAGCKDTVEHALTISQQGKADFTTTNVCEEAPMYFADASLGNVVEWEWNFGDDSSLSNVASPQHTYATPGLYTVTLSITTAEGCKDRVTKQVEVYKRPVAGFDIPTGVCLDKVLNPTDQSSVNAPQQLTGWIWDFGDGTAVYTQQASHTFDNQGSYTVSLAVTTNQGCKDTLNQLVKIGSYPVIDFTLDRTKGCTPLCVKGDATANVMDGTVSKYKWLYEEQVVGTADHLSWCTAKTGSQFIALSVTSDLGCESMLSKPIEVYPNPSAGFTASPPSSSIMNPEITFMNSSVGASSYYWNFGDGHDTDKENPVHVYEHSALYLVTLKASNMYGCEANTSHVIVIDSIYSVHIPNAFSPNGDGIHDVFQIENIAFFPQAVLEIYDQWGNKVFKSNPGYPSAWDGTKDGQALPVSSYYYILHLNKDGKTQHTGYITLIR